MAVIQMPGRGKKDETGMITNWYKKTGDWVAQGDELFSFDTDEGTYTVKSQKAGRLVAIFVPEGELVHCPADVGMLAAPSPDSVLRMGRMPFAQEAKAAQQLREPEEKDTKDAKDAKEAEVLEEEQEVEMEDAQDMHEVLAVESAPDGAQQSPSEINEDQPQETAEEDEAASIELQLPVAEEEILQAIEDETEEIPIVEDAPEQPQAEPEETVAPLEAQQQAPIEAPLEETQECAAEIVTEEEEEEVEEEAEPVELQPQPCACAAAPACMACITAHADVTTALDIVDKTQVTLAALVRYAAMHTQFAQQLDEVADGTLRGMSGGALPNICDVSALGITGVMRSSGEGITFTVPSPSDAWRIDGDGVACYPRLSLALTFDENLVSFENAVQWLKRTCENLENILQLLI